MGKILLVVDDELDLLTVTKARLVAAGFSVLVAGSGEEALLLLKDNKPDLLLLDLLLPGIQGEDLCKKLKADDQFKKMRIIIFTAKSLRFPEAIKEMGADDFVQKPFDSKDLIEKIRKQIG